jgi:hypothetical protein
VQRFPDLILNSPPGGALEENADISGERLFISLLFRVSSLIKKLPARGRKFSSTEKYIFQYWKIYFSVLENFALIIGK